MGFSDLQAEILFAISDNDLLGYAHVGLPICPEQISDAYGTMEAVPHTPLALCASRDDSYLTPQGLHLFASPLIGNLSREYGSSHYYQ